MKKNAAGFAPKAPSQKKNKLKNKQKSKDKRFNVD
jgi:hypothetical protein